MVNYARVQEHAEGVLAWAYELCALLDEIERASDDERVLALTGSRFEIARRHGFKVTFYGETSGGTH